MQKLQLQVLLLNDSIGFALNKKTKKGWIPLTNYFFWPLTEAWELIQFELKQKNWIKPKEITIVLNLIVDTMNNCINSTPNNKKFLSIDLASFASEIKVIKTI